MSELEPLQALQNDEETTTTTITTSRNPNIDKNSLCANNRFVNTIIRLIKILMDWFTLILMLVLPSLTGDYAIVYAVTLAVGLFFFSFNAYRYFVWKTIKTFPKFIEITIILINFSLLLYELIAKPSQEWSSDWAGVISNGCLFVVVLFSILIQRPFTIQYAMDSTEERLWKLPSFYQTNVVISSIWGAEFGLSLMFALLGVYFYHDNPTARLVPGLITLVAAFYLSSKYPEYARKQVLKNRINQRSETA